MSNERSVVITGGAKGIGAASAGYLLEQGWDVHTLDLAPTGIPGVTHHVVDVTDPEQQVAVAGEIGAIDALVTVAGVNLRPSDGPAQRLDLDAWHRTIAINLTGTMLSVRAFYPHLREAGSIVTLGSTAAIGAMPWADAYTASKGAIVALTRAWAVDYSRYGIRVNCVCPGATATDMMGGVLDAFDDASRLQLPQQRLATPREIASVIAFLCGPESTYLSGAVIPVDGSATSSVGGMPFPRRRSRP